MIKKLAVLLALVVAASVSAACTGGDDAAGHQTHTAPNGDEFNDADVAFATDMIQHHAQALQLVDLTMGRQLSPQVQQLAEGVRMARVPEIEQMKAWLTAWEQPVPPTVRDHAHAHGDGDTEVDPDMPGMVSRKQMAELESADRGEFQQMWLEMMIEHDRGAIEMARTERSEGIFRPGTELARSIELAHQEEIAMVEKLLGS